MDMVRSFKITRELLESGFSEDPKVRKFLDNQLREQVDRELLRAEREARYDKGIVVPRRNHPQRYKVTILLPPTVTWRDRMMITEVAQLESSFRYSLMKPIDYHLD